MYPIRGCLFRGLLYHMTRFYANTSRCWNWAAFFKRIYLTTLFYSRKTRFPRVQKWEYTRQEGTRASRELHLFYSTYSILPVSGYNVPRYRMRDPHCSRLFLHKDGKHENYFTEFAKCPRKWFTMHLLFRYLLFLTQEIRKYCGSIKLSPINWFYQLSRALLPRY